MSGIGMGQGEAEETADAVADEQEARLARACIAAELFRKVDHRRFRHDGDASRGVLRRICDKGRLLQPEESRRS